MSEGLSSENLRKAINAAQVVRKEEAENADLPPGHPMLKLIEEAKQRLEEQEERQQDNKESMERMKNNRQAKEQRRKEEAQDEQQRMLKKNVNQYNTALADLMGHIQQVAGLVDQLQSKMPRYNLSRTSRMLKTTMGGLRRSMLK